jgi:DNA-binding NarL/FixJ family response regulator
MHVLAIEDHALFLDGLRHLLQALEPGLRVSSATSREDALTVLEERGSDLDLIVLDLSLPGTKPFELLSASRRLAPSAPVAVLSATEDRLEVSRAFELGAQGYLFKSESNAGIVAALRRVMAGELVSPSFDAARHDTTDAALTERQLEVLQLLARGESNKEIATRLGLTENTVKVHLAQCYRVLGVTTRTSAVLKGMRLGLVRDE